MKPEVAWLALVVGSQVAEPRPGGLKALPNAIDTWATQRCELEAGGNTRAFKVQTKAQTERDSRTGVVSVHLCQISQVYTKGRVGGLPCRARAQYSPTRVKDW